MISDLNKDRDRDCFMTGPPGWFCNILPNLLTLQKCLLRLQTWQICSCSSGSDGSGMVPNKSEHSMSWLYSTSLFWFLFCEKTFTQYNWPISIPIFLAYSWEQVLQLRYPLDTLLALWAVNVLSIVFWVDSSDKNKSGLSTAVMGQQLSDHFLLNSIYDHFVWPSLTNVIIKASCAKWV